MKDNIIYCPCGCFECSLGDAMVCCSPRPECSLHKDDPIIKQMFGGEILDDYGIT